MDPREFQRLAGTLAARRDPAALRSAISRSYYAAHHVVREFVDAAGIRVPGSGVGHQFLINLLGEAGDPELQETGRSLGDLYSRRLDADYRLSARDTEQPSTARFYVDLAGGIIKEVEGWLVGPRRTALASELKAVEARVRRR